MGKGIVIIPASGTTSDSTPEEFSWAAACKAVDGAVEVVRLGDETAMLVNEDGMLLNLPVNDRATDILIVAHRHGIIRGTVVLLSGPDALRSVGL